MKRIPGYEQVTVHLGNVPHKVVAVSDPGANGHTAFLQAELSIGGPRRVIWQMGKS
jgi:hypothetical protein